MRMMSRVLLILIGLLGVDGRMQPKPRWPASDTAALDLVGEWRAHLQFTSGAFAPVKDLEFMYVFNQGGTMTESSNYDAFRRCHRHTGSGGRSGPRSSRPSTSSM